MGSQSPSPLTPLSLATVAAWLPVISSLLQCVTMVLFPDATGIPTSPGGRRILAIAGPALIAIIAAISAATASTKSTRLNKVAPPFSSAAATVIVCCCPIVFLLLVEGAGLGLTLASARLLVTRMTLDGGAHGGIRRITQ